MTRHPILGEPIQTQSYRFVFLALLTKILLRRPVTYLGGQQFRSLKIPLLSGSCIWHFRIGSCRRVGIVSVARAPGAACSRPELQCEVSVPRARRAGPARPGGPWGLGTEKVRGVQGRFRWRRFSFRPVGRWPASLRPSEAPCGARPLEGPP